MGGAIGNYPNGEVPVEYLVHVSGVTYLPPGTYTRWLWMRSQAIERYGVTLWITSQWSFDWNAWNGYRPLGVQKKYREAYGNMAAWPGTSSHGGTYGGQQAFAIDVGNWMDLGWERFSALANEAGFRTNFVTPTELWHIADFNDPWAVPAFGGGSTVPKEWDEMATKDEIKAAVREVVAEEITNGSRNAVKIIGVPGGKMYLAGLGGVKHITTAEDLDLLRRFIKAKPYVSTAVNGEETFTQTQVNTIQSYLNGLA